MAGPHPKAPEPDERQGPPPGAWKPAREAALKIKKPLERFLHIETASGMLLLVMAVIAMAWANSPWQESYHHLFHTKVLLGIGEHRFEQSLHFWINDGLMVIFFFVVGLEIRREMHEGELAELRRAALPIAAAIGGMLVPAGIYLAFTFGRPELRHGWGIPMATDIAFAVGVLALVGNRVPPALRVLLLALAIIDDIGAILVIAFFYSSGVSISGIAVALAGVVVLLGFQRVGVRHALAYVLPGFIIWLGMLIAGIHPTIAGVIIGLLTPVRSWFGTEGFIRETDQALADFKQRDHTRQHELIAPLDRIQKAQKEALPPVIRLEAALHPWVAFGIMPVFALANAGVTLGSINLEEGRLWVALGVGLGLAIGKPVGVVLASLFTTKIGLATLPRGVDFKGLFVVGLVAGVGFTMALFVAALAFDDQSLLSVAKVAVLAGSLFAGIVGLVFGRLALPETLPEGAARTVVEAESSTDA